jgi:alcohol dehydrogenase class IV
MVTPFSIAFLPEIYFGQNTLLKLPDLAKRFGNKVILVTGKNSFLQSDYGQKLLSDLKNKNLTVELLSVSSEPTVTLIDDAVIFLKPFQADVIIGIGGGSVIDAAKAIGAMLKADGSIADYLEGNKNNLQHPGHKVPFIAVPTTAGTGSETTKNAVISNDGGLKRSLRHDRFIPDIAVVDPLLTLTCPGNVTAASGLDTFTQLFESYVSTTANSFTDLLALDGMRVAISSLTRAVENGNDVDARTGMAYAAMLSGITLSHADLGLVHGFASSIGGMFDVPHGVVCGTLLGAVNQKNIEYVLKDQKDRILINKYKTVASLFRPDIAGSDEHLLHSLADNIDKWIETLCIPRLSKYGISLSDADRIVAASGLKNNPVTFEKPIIKEILISRI